jgi:REP element-mobilizing transposase RayT
MRYFITFSCYGHHLHGDQSGSVGRDHNLPGSRLLLHNPDRIEAEHHLMDQLPYSLNQRSRTVVLDALRQVCIHRGWTLLAAHVRSTHVHVIVDAEVQPEKIMNDFKSYASRRLNRSGLEEPNRKRWARHGSTQWLWTDGDTRSAVRYVIEEQGETMAAFVAECI